MEKQNFYEVVEDDEDVDIETVIDDIKQMYNMGITNKKELLFVYLKNLGLNKMNLASIETIRKSVKDIIEKNEVEYSGIFESHGDNNLRFYTKKGTTVDIVNFTFIRNLSVEGSYNKIQLYKDSNNKQYIFRSALKKKELKSEADDEYLFRSFFENLKHFILYFLLKYYTPYNKYKIVPEVYYFGLYKNIETDEQTFITCMEMGRKTLGDYFVDINTNYQEMRNILFTIYRSLEFLNLIGLNFKHGDLKYNNILMSNKYKPMIIDFGKSSFILDDLNFGLDDSSAQYDNPYINITHDMMQLLCSLFIPKEVSLIGLEQSQNIDDYKINVYEIFKFNGSSNYILNSNVMRCVIKEKYGRLYIPYTNFYISSQKLKGVNLIEFKRKIPYIDLTITSSELASKLNITETDDEKIFDKYEKKYLKYKKKYIILKNKYNMK